MIESGDNRDGGVRQPGNHRGSMNLEQHNLLSGANLDENTLQMMELQALFGRQPSRWEQSESFSDYLSLCYEDFLDWYEELDFDVMKGAFTYFLDRFSLSITVRYVFIFHIVLV
jgi:hypothetical protein